MLNEQSTKKVRKILKLARIPFSSYLTALVDEFARVTDEFGVSKRLEKMTPSEAMHMMGEIFKGIEVEKKR